MSVIDVEGLLGEVSAEEPCGEDLEYDAAFGEMTRAAEGQAARQMGDSVIEAVGPDWGQVRRLALELTSRTKDLRVAVYLARALLNTDGFAGLGDGLRLLNGLIERYWEPVHPRLDPDDDNDPTLRVNTITILCDPEMTLRGAREAPLVEKRGLGRFSLRDIEVAGGQASPRKDEQPPEMAAIDAAFAECDLDELQATAAALHGSIEAMQALESTLTERVSTTHAVDLSALPKLLRAAHHVVAERLALRGIVTEGVAAEPQAGAAETGGGPPISGDIRSREDVVRVLDKICEYYNRYEPSSPIPLLLQRAKRLVSKSFMEIMRDMAPDGVSQAETIGGIREE